MMSSENSEFENSKTIEWRRVSPISIVYFFLKLSSHAINLWPVLIPIIAGGETFRDFFWNYLIYAIAALIAIGIFVKYWFFRFHVEQDCIHIRTGLFNKSRLTLNYERVQQADIVQPFYFRPFGLATLGLESAGSAQKEVALPGIPYEYANQLKQAILEHKSDSSKQPAVVESPEEAEGAAYRLLLKPMEVARYGLMHNGLIILLPLFAPLSQNPTLFRTYLSPLANTWLFDYIFQTNHEGSLFGLISSLALLCTFAITVLFLASIAVALFRFWNYDLQRNNDQFQYRAGLATISTKGFRLHKLQKVVISQGVIARLLKRSSLAITKAGTTVRHDGNPHADKQRFLVPVLTDKTLREFMDELDLPRATWKPVSRYYILAVGSLLSLLFGGITLVFLWSSDRPLLWVLPIITSLFLIAWRRWACWGVYHDADWLVVKTGFIGRRITFIPTPKTQKTTVYQPIWLRRFSLAQILVHSGAGLVMIPAIDATWAHQIRDQLLLRVTHYRKRWF